MAHAKTAAAPAIPNHSAILNQLYATGAFDLSTRDGGAVYVRAAYDTLRAIDPRFFLLRKSAGRTHVVDVFGERHGADAVLFLETPTRGIAIDLISNSATAKAAPGWMPDKYKEGAQKGQLAYRYTTKDAYAPVYDPIAPPLPPVTPAAQPTIHYHQFVFTDSRLIARAWLSKNPTTINPDDVSGSIQHIFEKAMELAYRLLADRKPVRQVLGEIGVNPDEIL